MQSTFAGYDPQACKGMTDSRTVTPNPCYFTGESRIPPAAKQELHCFVTSQ